MAKVYYRLDHGRGPHDGSEDDSEEFQDWLTRWVDDKISEVKMKFETLFRDHGGRLPVYRSITADEWTPRDGLGVYWSWDRDAAEPHWGHPDHNRTYLLRTEITTDDVQWGPTLAMNANPDFEHEKEIRLKSRIQKPLTGLWVSEGGDFIEAPEGAYLGKTFLI